MYYCFVKKKNQGRHIKNSACVIVLPLNVFCKAIGVTSVNKQHFTMYFLPIQNGFYHPWRPYLCLVRTLQSDSF